MKSKGVLLVNLGSPDSPNPKDVKKYLDEFLMDERVIDLPYWKRFLLVKGIILKTRPKKSAALYKKIWTDEGSPLVVHSSKLKGSIESKIGQDAPSVELGMRYGSKSIRKAIVKLHDQGVDDILVIPLYPQYAMSSTETVVEKVKKVTAQVYGKEDVGLSFFPSFYNKEEYILAKANLIHRSVDIDEYDRVIFSYHSIPERHIFKTDPTQNHCKINGTCCNTSSVAHETCYLHQCLKTTEGVVSQLNWPKEKVINSFQSKLGRAKWLNPSTAELLNELPEKGIKKIAVITPSFVADCLETLEEIDMDGRKCFMENGGELFTLVPCLNLEENWVEAISKWTMDWYKQVA